MKIPILHPVSDYEHSDDDDFQGWRAGRSVVGAMPEQAIVERPERQLSVTA